MSPWRVAIDGVITVAVSYSGTDLAETLIPEVETADLITRIGGPTGSPKIFLLTAVVIILPP
jgi:hypothetical protein